ncbi:50S ribosomal protein L23 [Candidatus Gracilibacteria bacterium]|nr:MAG: 50S ribosomal protein L23 [Candidatus Gracilibacteria bacterium]PIE85731.1 MAG: 50S ribosomal protein L23 [Candidatus Gracilibacteria bacterium]
MRLYKVLKKPIVTEKTSLMEMKTNTYVCQISSDATKIDIKKAILEIYKVEVSSVNIVNTRLKVKQGRKGAQIKKRAFKKAYITLKNKTDKIDFSVFK